MTCRGIIRRSCRLVNSNANRPNFRTYRTYLHYGFLPRFSFEASVPAEVVFAEESCGYQGSSMKCAAVLIVGTGHIRHVEITPGITAEDAEFMMTRAFMDCGVSLHRSPCGQASGSYRGAQTGN